MSQASQRLSDDHEAVSNVLKQLLTALNNRDVATYSKLDLLWARLAVHIRAEHLHLFPTVLTRLTGSTDVPAAPELSEAQTVVENLRGDHDFFMRELARAIGILRELSTKTDRANGEAGLTSVEDTVREIEKRLVAHNEVEEKKIYSWASTLLTQSEQTELLKRINAELENRPPRFSVEVWANQ